MAQILNKKREQRHVIYAFAFLLFFLTGFSVKVLHHHEKKCCESEQTIDKSFSKVDNNCSICIAVFIIFHQNIDFIIQSILLITLFRYLNYNEQQLVNKVLENIFLRGPPTFVLY